MKKRAPLILSLTFFLSSLAILQQVNYHFAPTQEPVPIAQISQQQTAETMQVAGVWDQYSVDGDGQRYFMARLDMQGEGADYTATPTAIAEDVFPKHAYSSYDHSYDNGVWSFREDWDDGDVGQFVLERQPNGEYAGTATSLDGSQCFSTVFVRVED